MPRDPRVDAYITGKAEFSRPILNHLRERVHTACPEADETIRWSMPSFSYRGKILAQMAAFKAYAVFAFWDHEASGMERKDGAMGQRGRLTSLADLPPDAELDQGIHKAMAAIDSGDKPVRLKKPPKPEAEIPPELAAALAKDALATQTFTGFPPSCRREYCEWIGEAKRQETRDKRVTETMEWLRAGKRRNWKYENC